MKNKLKIISAVCCSLLMVSACTGTNALPGIYSANEGMGLTMVGINHTGRDADQIFVDKKWAANIHAYGGGGGGVCCYTGTKDINKLVTVTVKWGYFRKKNSLPTLENASSETRIYTTHLPGSPKQEYSYLCVILRNYDKVDLAFSHNRGDCAEK